VKLRFEQNVAAPKFKQNLAGLHDRFADAMTATANILASMIQEEGRANIASSGHFGSDWTDGLHVTAEPRGATANMRISMTHDKPFAGIFEEGGTISGNPLLWLPISGTDAVGKRAADYGDMFSVQRQGKPPLLFSMADKQPKYFGIESVTIPQKWHLREIQKSVMANFRSVFDTQFRK
jgi:hypothetical protein